jgi:type I restriction enzyme R subunit
MSQALSSLKEDNEDGEIDPEDTVNEALAKRIGERKMLTNASYFAFTATPKNKTLEMFGEPLPPDAEGKVKHQPFHSYTMKQAIDEGFILDVLKSYTPVDSYYKLVKKTENDPEFDTKKAKKKLRRYVESHDHAIRLKAEIMVDHFHEQVLAAGKIGGQARAMVVTSCAMRAGCSLSHSRGPRQRQLVARCLRGYSRHQTGSSGTQSKKEKTQSVKKLRRQGIPRGRRYLRGAGGLVGAR